MIATVLNEASNIGNLMQSLAGQRLDGMEIVIVDGGSKDGTWEELQRIAASEARLRVIRDESCNLVASPGPIARGRNRAISEASAEVIACADAGCEYGPEWAAKLTAPIVSGEAEYSLGGSYIDPKDATIWDVAAAPFLGVKLNAEGVRKSCTTRSMGMTKSLWERVGGFPEVNLFGEDTLFDLRARELAAPVFPAGAMAKYRPRFTFFEAAKKLGLYAASDGVLGVRRMRLVRNLLRCMLQVIALVSLRWTAIPLLVDIALEMFFAFERDIRGVLGPRFLALLPARLIFSVLSPWIVSFNHLRGNLTKKNLSNPQNA